MWKKIPFIALPFVSDVICKRRGVLLSPEKIGALIDV
jgi:hypothetical protein